MKLLIVLILVYFFIEINIKINDECGNHLYTNHKGHMRFKFEKLFPRTFTNFDVIKLDKK